MEYEYRNGMWDRYATTEASHKAMHILIDKGLWSFQQPEEHLKANRALGHRNYGKSWLEEKMGWALTQLGIKFESQYPIRYGVDILNRPKNYFPDFAIVDKNLLIECDGNAWHKDETRDKLRQARIENLGWRFIRFPEDEINKNVMDCAYKVKSLALTADVV